MNLLKETGLIEKLIDEFKNEHYVGGAEDSVLRDKAKEIFERIDEAIRGLRSETVVVSLLKETRSNFGHLITAIYQHRHAPQLKKFYFLYKKKNRF